MDNDQYNRIVTWGFGAFAVLVIANMIFLRTNRNAALKRRVSVVLTAVIAITMVSLWLLMGAWWVSLTILPFIALVVAFNFRRIRFCDACGLTNQVMNPFRSNPPCGGCGQPLDTNRRWL